jgi:hypothetical protein
MVKHGDATGPLLTRPHAVSQALSDIGRLLWDGVSVIRGLPQHLPPNRGSQRIVLFWRRLATRLPRFSNLVTSHSQA